MSTNRNITPKNRHETLQNLNGDPARGGRTARQVPGAGGVMVRPDLGIPEDPPESPTDQDRYDPEGPQNRAAEESLVGAILIDPDVLGEVRLIVKGPSDFCEAIPRWVYAASIRLADRGDILNARTVLEEVRHMGHTAAEIRPADMTLLVNTAGTSLNAEHDARNIRSAALRRGIMSAIQKTAEIIHSETLSDEEVITFALEFLQSQTVDWSIDPWRAAWRTLADSFEPRAPREFAIADLIGLPSLVCCYGAPGDLKTLLLQDMAISIAAGLDFLPAAPWKAGGRTFAVKPYPVLWLDFDNGEDDTAERFSALARAKKIDPNISNLRYVSMPEPWLILSDPSVVQRLTQQIKQFDARVVFIDNLGVTKGAADEKTDEMTPVMSHLRQVVEKANCALVFIHHQTKNAALTARRGDTMRGHGSIEAAVNLALLVEREPGSDIVTVQSTKTRGMDVAPFSATFTYTHRDDSTDLDTATFYSLPCENARSPQAIGAEIRTQLADGPMLKTDLAKRTHKALEGVGINRVRDFIDRMIANDEIITTPGGKTTGLLCALR